MDLYDHEAPELAEQAAEEAIARAGIHHSRITDVIVVSCTGFSAPGIDVALVDRLQLRRTVRRNTIGFMGCFGAISGLRAAMGMCAADPTAVVLLVCVELCSLHGRHDRSAQNMVGAALFADGAAAAIVASGGADDCTRIGRLGLGRSFLAPNGRGDMTWTITDQGFAMNLSPGIPQAVREVLASSSVAADLRPGDAIVAHPGGPKVLDAIESGLELPGDALAPSRAVLSEFGNMSSPTVLFVLREWLRRGEGERLLRLFAFGPGLTTEMLPLIGAGSDKSAESFGAAVRYTDQSVLSRSDFSTKRK